MPESGVEKAVEEAAAKVIARALRHRGEQVERGEVGNIQTQTPDQVAQEVRAAIQPFLAQPVDPERLRAIVTSDEMVTRIFDRRNVRYQEEVDGQSPPDSLRDDLAAVAEELIATPGLLVQPAGDGKVAERAQALLAALDTAEKLAAGGAQQEANVNAVLTAAAHELRDALESRSECPACGETGGHGGDCPVALHFGSRALASPQPENSGDDYAVVSAADAQRVIDCEPRFQEMRDALLPYLAPDNFGEGTDQMREFNAAAALARLLPLIRREVPQNSGGVEEWPAVWVLRDQITGTVRSPSSVGTLSSIPPVEALAESSRLYVPADAAPAQPQLSDEDRGSLERIASVLTRHAENADASGAYGSGLAAEYEAGAAFLRKLASQSVEGEAHKEHTLGEEAEIAASQHQGKEGQAEAAHHYLSTACFHDLHQRCRLTCKFCQVECECSCHRSGSSPSTPPSLSSSRDAKEGHAASATRARRAPATPVVIAAAPAVSNCPSSTER